MAMKITNAKVLASATVKAGLVGIGLVALLLLAGYAISPLYTRVGNSATSNVTKISETPSAASTINQSHAHAELTVFLNGVLLNFSGSKYQTKDLLMHFEGGDGFTLHKHSRNAWLGPFFESLGMKFADDCLTLDNGSSYCTNLDS